MLVKHLVKSVFDVCEELDVDPTGLTIDVNSQQATLITTPDSKFGSVYYCENYKDVYDALKHACEEGLLQPVQPSECGKCKTCKCGK